jgi:hypothetical protein
VEVVMSLRTFHLFFIWICILGADLFGVWAIWSFVQTGDALTLGMGIVTILGGCGLVVYAVRFVKNVEQAGTH